ncbi:type II toxin-antitoxin system PemK/MazF family toxin [Algoriphagus sp.]|uniref:type II toxin-antitoxin system PemK/MazF family toxin n=1 Tax=Algoriphagus sp. TaxID=1872435 RepID=UPI003273E85D
MEGFVKGSNVVVSFPFSDLSASKRRPALVLANAENGDYLLCQITSKSIKDKWAIALPEDQIIEGPLFKESNILANRILTADQRIILYKAGFVDPTFRRKVVEQIIQLIS